MSLISEFLGLVLPWQGTEETTFKSIWYRFKGDDGKMGTAGNATQSLAELVRMAEWQSQRGHDVYVGLGTQRTANAAKEGRKWMRSNRLQSNIVSLKCLFIDIDAGNKGYPDTAAAFAALDEFCIKAELPPPTIEVASGSGGLHVYWVLDIPLPVMRWQPLADALARATDEHGLMCDRACTVDCARILRVPATFNHKTGTPMPVEMGTPGEVYSLAFIEAALKPFMGPQPYKGPRQQAFEYSELQKRFMDGLAPDTSEPIDLFKVARCRLRCARRRLDDGGANHSQPLWNLLMLAATWDIDPYSTAHQLSEGYATYDPAEVDEMLARKQRERETKPNLGWPSCFAFAREHSACKTCPHYSDNKSPLNLLNKPGIVALSNDLPDDYWRDVRGFIRTKLTPKDKDPIDQIVLPYELWDAMLTPSGDFYCKTRIGDVERHVHIERKDTTTKDKIVGALVHNHVYPAKDIQRTLVGNFFMAWMQKLHDIKTARVTPAVLGWNPGLTEFTYGETTHKQSGDAKAFFVDDSAMVLYRPVGKPDPWMIAAKFVTDERRPALDVILAAAFAAPLVALTGMPGLLLTAYSTESGIGKTTAMKVAQAVWGHPVKAMQALDDTPMSIMKKLADVQSLPIFWDELKMRSEIEGFVKLLFRLTQGKDKSRLNRDAEAREVGSFSTMMVAASNDSIAEAMGRAVDTTTAGANRVFEIIVPPAAVPSSYTTATVNRMIANLNVNYGHAGATYAAYLGQYAKQVESMVLAIQNRLEQALNISTEERFWVATIACLIVGASIANDLKLTTIDLPAMQDFLCDTLSKQRVLREETVSEVTRQVNVEELIAKLLADLAGKHLIETDYVAAWSGKPKANSLFTDTTKLQVVWAQYGRSDNILRVTKGQFAKWLVGHKQSPSNVYDALKKHYGARDVLARLGSGVSDFTFINMIAKAKQRCMDIQLPPTSSQPPGSTSST